MKRKNDVYAAYQNDLTTVCCSGYYKQLFVMAVKEGESVFNGDVKLIDDDDQREQANTIGYFAMFKLDNGFCKSSYQSKEQMKAYAENSQDPSWMVDFEAMAFRTILRQLLINWGPMSKAMQARS